MSFSRWRESRGLLQLYMDYHFRGHDDKKVSGSGFKINYSLNYGLKL